jgi:predicted PurR-regulated permease PerM
MPGGAGTALAADREMSRDVPRGSDEAPTQRVSVGTPVRWLAGLLALAALAVAREMIGTIVLASWFATTFWSLRERLVKKTASPRLVSAMLTTGIAVTIVAPFTLIAVYIGLRAGELVQAVRAALEQGELVKTLEGTLTEQEGRRGLSDLYREAARAAPTVLASVGTVFRFASDAVVKIFLFVLGTYTFFAKGSDVVHWIERASPLPPEPTRRLMRTYAEAGRGILVGVFLIIVLHGVVAVIGYAIIGVPRPVELGVLTALAGLVPAIGTGLVWVPLSAILALTGHPVRGLAVFVLGLVIGSVDNLFRPYLSKLGHVPLPTFALFVAFFGGIAVFGPSGILLGPLVFALAKGARDEVVAEKERATSGEPAPGSEGPEAP